MGPAICKLTGYRFAIKSMSPPSEALGPKLTTGFWRLKLCFFFSSSHRTMLAVSGTKEEETGMICNRVNR